MREGSAILYRLAYKVLPQNIGRVFSPYIGKISGQPQPCTTVTLVNPLLKTASVNNKNACIHNLALPQSKNL